jgi:hypothetical protein
MELKAVHSGPEVLRQLDRYMNDDGVRNLSPGKPLLGAVIAPSYQRSIIDCLPPVRLYEISTDPLRVALTHDGWK